MKAWLKAINPLATIDTEAEAVMAARASSISLWLSGAKWIIAALLMIKGMSQLRADMAAGSGSQMLDLVGAGMAEAAVAITAAVGLFQIILGGVQWRARTTVIPIIFLILAIYGLGQAVWSVATGSGSAASGWSTMLSYFTLGVAVVFHWVGYRGAARLEQIHRVR